LAPLDVVFSTHEVPSHRFADSPIKVADGIWIILDLLLSFLETTKHDASSAYPSQTPRDKLIFIERAVSIVALLLYSLDRLGQHRPSLGFHHSEHRQQQEYDFIRSHPLFPRYTSAIRWYCSPARTSKFSQLGARYYFERTRTTSHQVPTDEEHRRLSHEIGISLGNLQRSLSVSGSAFSSNSVPTHTYLLEPSESHDTFVASDSQYQAIELALTCGREFGSNASKTVIFQLTRFSKTVRCTTWRTC
jgi:hypothetical protein